MNETTVWEIVRVDPEEPNGYAGGWATGYTEDIAKEHLAFLRGHWVNSQFEAHKVVTKRERLDW